MIQIQDNSQASNDPVVAPEPAVQAAPTNPAPVAIPDPVPTPVEPAPANEEANPIQGLVGDVKAPEPVVAATSQENSAPTQASEAEIDDLLAQLEKLSKEIEEKAESGTETPVAQPASAPTEKTDFTSAVETAAPTEALKEAPQVNDEFDMDKFLKDLEQKIEAENGQEDADPAFRKNRVADVGGIETEAEEDLTPAFTEAPKAAPVIKKQDLVKEVDELLDQAAQQKPSTEVAKMTVDKPAARAKAQDLTKEVDELLDLVTKQAGQTIPTAQTEAPAIEKPETEEVSDAIEDASSGQALEAQSIFEMLNIEDISAEEREEFLTELEELIWEDFVKTDLPLMLTTEEYAGAEEILNSQKEEDQKKEDLLVYIEKILPDIEEIMYEKAIGLKEEMFMERIRKMEEAAVGDEQLLAKIAQAKSQAQAGQWQAAVETLNQV